MGVRTEWATPESLHVEVLDEYEDQYGTTLDEGCVGLAISADTVFLIEGTLEGFKELAQEILDAVKKYELESEED